MDCLYVKSIFVSLVRQYPVCISSEGQYIFPAWRHFRHSV
jgi:hypothetical protein